MKSMPLFAAAFIAFQPSAHAASDLPPGCTIQNVQLKKVNYRYSGSYAYVTAIINHSCKGAVGVELRWASYYSDGSVAFATSFWPNSISNIPANFDFPFESLRNSSIPPARYTLTVNSVNAW